MKLSSPLIVLSVLVNLVIVGLFFLRPSLAPAALRSAFDRGGLDRAAAAAKVQAAQPARTAKPSQLWPLLATEDLSTLISRLRAAGFPAAVIREIILAEINSRYDARLRAFIESDASTPFWKLPPNSFRAGQNRIEEYSQLQRERTKLQRALLADPFFASEDVNSGQRRQFGNLPRQKVDAVQRVEDDYAEMISAIRTSSNGILLPEDREKLAFLAREKREDLARELTPAELADYEVRSSPITRMLSGELGEFRASETEFRAIFDLHREMNEKLPYYGSSAMNFNERRTLQQQLEQGLRTKLGDARFADYQRETSSDFHQLRRLVQRENLPPETGVRAFDLRNTVSTESMRIYNDASLDGEKKRAALASLAQTTRAQLVAMLGPVAGPAYVQTLDNQWLRMLENGAAITFDGGPNRSFGSENVMISFGGGPNFRGVPALPRPPPPR